MNEGGRENITVEKKREIGLGFGEIRTRE